ncbi:uncharacterized protein TM35_001161040 [Trypanosoma theileri]|uniref:Mucin TcMUCII n=1 Tax=Trypanosoma theileri TaxID=67003 RepID=A0A1X0NDV3_9TRYP|nr:uncharacterized protein TM35_001161040 [Trypanosoma theileri]ORC81429.1 hypothetical protein TM35_001161040 [Trypanosoma theileri]
MMMIMHRVMCVLAVVLCCACGCAMSNGSGGVASLAPSMSEFPYTVNGGTTHTSGEIVSRENKAERDRVTDIKVEEQHHTLPEKPEQTRALGEPLTDTSHSDSRSEGRTVSESGMPGTEHLVKPTTTHVAEITKPVAAERPLSADQSSGTTTKTAESQTQEHHLAVPKEQNQPTQGNQESSNNTGDNTTPGDHNTSQQSPTDAGVTTNTTSHENNTAGSAESPDNTTSEAPTTTPSPAPNTEINSTIASAVQKKANADSSVSPVWMRTAAPLLIMVVLFSATVY